MRAMNIFLFKSLLTFELLKVVAQQTHNGDSTLRQR